MYWPIRVIAANPFVLHALDGGAEHVHQERESRCRSSPGAKQSTFSVYRRSIASIVMHLSNAFLPLCVGELLDRLNGEGDSSLASQPA